MKYIDEYRDGKAAQKFQKAIHRIARSHWGIMEICGGQTHSIVRFGIDKMLPDTVQLIHGPGCPVCVTPGHVIDEAITLAASGAVVCTFGDMMRVPGSQGSLMGARAVGGDVRIVYSPLDAVRLAAADPGSQFVFLAVGFETTAPVNATAVVQADVLGLKNFSLLVSQVRVPPALKTLLVSPDCRIDGILAAGHVCTIMGYEEYDPIASEFKVPIVVTGFEPVDILQGIYMCIKQLEAGRAVVQNQYARAVQRSGNALAVDRINDVFQIADMPWRGLGILAQGGLRIRDRYSAYDARRKFVSLPASSKEDPRCIAGSVLTGRQRPDQCPEFGLSCTPDHPLGAPMVSSEGTCSAYYQYRRRDIQARPVATGQGA